MGRVIDRLEQTQNKINNSQANAAGAMDTPELKVGRDIKSEYDMWSWIFQEISNLRVEVSRLGTLVRVNNSSSPEYLPIYHAHIYSLLIPMSVIVSDDLWKKIYKLWLDTEQDIQSYNTQRRNVPNKKIPFELIKKLDNLYRAALIVGQRAGIGFKTTLKQDFEASVEKAITGG